MGKTNHTNSNLDLTVSIVNWNTGPLLISCLEAVFSRIKRHSFQVVVVDNNSTDNSMELVSRRFPEVKTICNSSNKGYARAHNQVLSLINSRYALLLNPDCIVAPGTIDDIIDFLDIHSTAGLASCKNFYPGGSIMKTVIQIPNVSNELIETIKGSFYPFDRLIRDNDIVFHSAVKPTEVEAVGGPFLLAKMKMVRTIGLMEDAFFLFSEEVDWCLSARQRGWKIIYFPNKIVHHHLGTSRKKAGRSFSEYHFHRSRLLFFRKHYGLPRAVLLAAIYSFFSIWMLLVETVKNIVSRTFGKERDNLLFQMAKARTKAVFDVVKSKFELKAIKQT